jgi:hypothetical protein
MSSLKMDNLFILSLNGIAMEALKSKREKLKIERYTLPAFK